MCQKGRKLDKHNRWINESSEQGLCLICNKNLQRKRGELGKNSEILYTGFCQTCHDSRIDYSNNTKGATAYRVHKKDSCEECGFIPKHQCQLDVDHIDGNHDNNEESNLQTLCSNCHRLKSYEERKIHTDARKEMVTAYFLEQEEFKKSLEKTIRYRKSAKGIQYTFYMKPFATEKEIESYLNKGIADGTIIGEVRRKKALVESELINSTTL